MTNEQKLTAAQEVWQKTIDMCNKVGDCNKNSCPFDTSDDSGAEFPCVLNHIETLIERFKMNNK